MQLKQIQNSNPKFRLLSGDVMTGFVQAAVVGTEGVGGAAFRRVIQVRVIPFCAAHLPVRLDIQTKFPYFLFLTWWSKIKNQEFRLYI